MRRFFLIAIALGAIIAGFVWWGNRRATLPATADERAEIPEVGIPSEVGAATLQSTAVGDRIGVFLQHKLLVPAGWEISLFAAGMRKPRMLAADDRGTVYVTAMDEGRVYALPDKDQDGVAEPRVVAANLRRPSGIVWHDGLLFVAEEGSVSTIRPETEERKVIIANLPTSGNHLTRTLAIRGEKLYVSVGSSCNVCADDPRRAAVLEFNLDGSGERVYASGLRNAVGLIVGPDGRLWATDNGRDHLGDDLPPEEVNVVEEGKDYGWPRCYGAAVPDPAFGSVERCKGTAQPEIAFQAHSAPLGLRFLSESWPEEYRGNLIVASHGSWNRSVPTGYKLFRMVREAGGWRVADFVTGWLLENGEAWGRPVDVLERPDGSGLLVTDDKVGVVYLLAPGP